GTSARSYDDERWAKLNRDNLKLCRSLGHEVVLACAICLRNLEEAKRQLAPRDMREAQDALPALVSVAEALGRPEMIEAIRTRAQDDLEGLRLAAYYGCQLWRDETKRILDDRPIERIVEALGGESAEWFGSTTCCGGPVGYAASEALTCIERVLGAAQDARAQAIVTICPLCHLQLDARQDELTATRGRLFRIPVFHLTELVGIVLGVEEAETWIRRHLTSVMELIFALDRERQKAKNEGDDGEHGEPR
ncbi:MAG: heterodisulfide reductase-related iron-sulfur binding cluster, partial [Planctomycetota bacterium]